MGGGAGGGGNGGRSGGGGGGSTNGDAGQPGEVVREANKANAPAMTSQQLADMHVSATKGASFGEPKYAEGMKKFVSEIKAKGISQESFPKTEKGQSDWRFVERSMKKYG